MKFKKGDKVRILYGGVYHYGEVTIAKEEESKVIFDGNSDLDYWYYNNSKLELITEKDLKDND